MDFQKYISPLSVMSLEGRVVRIPGPTPESPEVLFIYGHHSSLERWQGVSMLLSKRASVTMPDLPGFGGMESLYKIGKSATIDNLADYLASFIRQNYTNKKFIIVGMSLGFVIATRALQRHPELTPKVQRIISLFGFAHHSDFILPPKRFKTFLWGSRVFSLPVLATAYKKIALSRFVLSRTYHKTPHAKEKFKHLSSEQQKTNLEFEIGLWQNDDLRTYMKTGHEFLTLDNTKVKINLPVYHISVAQDRYFDNESVMKHLKQIYQKVELLTELQSGTHAPTQIATAEEARELIPNELLEII